MALKIYTAYKKLAIIAIALLGFWVIENWAARAGISNQQISDQKSVMVAQSETRTTNLKKTALSPEGNASESKIQEEGKTTRAKEQPIRDFRPSEKIEAGQGVDFPYDI